MLDPDVVGAWVRDHFARVSDEEFIANVRRFNPDLALEVSAGDLWQRALLAERHFPEPPVSTRALLVGTQPAVEGGSGANFEWFMVKLLEDCGFAVTRGDAGFHHTGIDVVVYLSPERAPGHTAAGRMTVVFQHGESVGAEVRSTQPPEVWFTYRTPDDLMHAAASVLLPVRRLAEQAALSAGKGVNLVGSRIRFFREGQGLSREELAKRVMGLTAQTLARMEDAPDDVSNPDLLLLRRLASVLNTTVAQLVEPTPMDLSVVPFPPAERFVA